MGASPNISKIVTEAVTSMRSRLKEFREELHMHPEPGWEEKQTTQRIQQFLQEIGLSEFIQPLPTGGWVDLVIHADKPFVLLRADIDALPVPDKKSVPYRSQHPGFCHACGHDVHTTVMLGVAAILQKLELTPPLNVRFLFQPAEEPIPSGAPKMVEKGALRNVKFALAMHVEPRLPLGVIGLTSGWINMQSIRLDITLEGPGGHSARPYETADLIWLASRLIQQSYGVINREIDWFTSPCVLTFTEIEAGEGYNIIPRKLRLTGTLRVTDDSTKNKFLLKLRNILQEMETENGIRSKLQRQEGSPAVLNNEELIRKLATVVQKMEPTPPPINRDYRSPGGDDFGFISRKVPSAMVRFGIKTRDDQPALHSSLFDVPWDAAELAMQFFLLAILDLN